MIIEFIWLLVLEILKANNVQIPLSVQLMTYAYIIAEIIWALKEINKRNK